MRFSFTCRKGVAGKSRSSRSSAGCQPRARHNGRPKPFYAARRGDVISPEARSEFNRRLKAEGKPAGRWGAAETAVQRLLGKELLVLLWAIELPGVTPEEIAVAIRNWLGLKPEERWWLYTMTAAATGLAHQQGLGWRGALRCALCFGTRSGAFHLGAVTGRGTLEPKVNETFATSKPKRAKSKKSNDPSFLWAAPLPAD